MQPGKAGRSEHEAVTSPNGQRAHRAIASRLLVDARPQQLKFTEDPSWSQHHIDANRNADAHLGRCLQRFKNRSATGIATGKRAYCIDSWANPNVGSTFPSGMFAKTVRPIRKCCSVEE